MIIAFLLVCFTAGIFYAITVTLFKPPSQSNQSPPMEDPESAEESSEIGWTLKQEKASPWAGFMEQTYLVDMIKENGLQSPPKFVKKEKPTFNSVPLKDILVGDKRLLLDSNNLTSPGIIGFDKQSQGNYEYYMYQYIFTNVHQYSSNLVLYPYNFSYTQNGTTTNFTKGAVFSTTPTSLPIQAQYNYFNSVATSTDVLFGKAKALYDINIAILSITAFYEDINMELTYESSSYCNLLTNYLGKYNGCLNTDQLKQFLGDTKNTGKTALVMLNNTDISGNSSLFYPDGTNRYQLLIIPDIFQGSEDLITSSLGAVGIQKIINYLNQGGMVFASGKSGYLLEKWQILSAGTYNTNQLLSSVDSNLVVKLTGCGSQTSDFLTSLICLNTQVSDGNTYSYLLSAYFMNPQAASNLTVLQSYDTTSASLRKKSLTGTTSNLTPADLSFLPFATYLPVGKGRAFMVNGNPLFKGNYNTIFYNYLMLAMSKNVMMDDYVGLPNNIPIPGGEAGFQLDLKISFINLYDTTVNDPVLHIYLNNFLSAPVIPDFCAPDTSNVSQIDPTTVNITTHIKCSKDNLTAFDRIDVMMKIQVEDFRATQQMNDILMADCVVNYTDSETGVISTYDIGGIRTNAALAAVLAGDLNPDPSSFYPLPGKGVYIDNLIGVGNKEATPGSNVDYVSVVPLITPVVDGDDQTAVGRMANFFNSYYCNRTPMYYFPFRSAADQQTDYLDYKYLTGKAVVMSADWDTPVKVGKVMRNSSFPNITVNGPVDALNCNWSIVVDSLVSVIIELWYPNSDIFYELATQRLLAFVNTNLLQGAAAIYPDGIPPDEESASFPGTRKRDLVWARNDVYFYDTTEMVLPNNINYTHIISLDRYPRATDPCVSTFGDSHSKILQQGYFGNEFPGGLKPHEWSNEMLNYCDRHQISMQEAANISNGSIIPVHYLVPVTSVDILRADDIMNFTAYPDGSGFYTAYPELKFVYASEFNVWSAAGQGGRFDIQLPMNVIFINGSISDPVNDSLITFSSGGLAFYKTTYDNTTNMISSWFRVGGQASNATAPSLVTVMIEQLNDTSNMTITVNSYLMKFDLSSNQTQFEKYFLDTVQTVTMYNDRFYSLPAVEIHCHLNRSNNTAVMPYESIDTFSRIGLYIQELLAHRTVYGAAESHHPTNPGSQGLNGGFSTISNLGTSSIPMSSFVTHGSGLLIPNAPRTARLEWDDIWGRRWINPLRTVFPDVPPVPSPLMNFAMTTTFEVTKTGQTTRVLEWDSDEVLDARVQIKLWNPYPKYWEINLCKENEVDFWQDQETHYEYERIFDVSDGSPYPFQINSTVAPGNSYHINVGHRSTYGVCFDVEGTVVQGVNLTADQRNKTATGYLCANTLNETEMAACAVWLAGLPTVNARPAGNTAPIWIYSPEVDSYYPKNFIKPNMWDLTAPWYESNPMNKAMPWHMDNNLPGMDYGPAWNPSRIKPHNIISFPIWKGFGFQISYDFTKSLPRFPKYKGWWSDNLQNKDNTLWAGNNVSNDISVDKNISLDDSMWIAARDLINPITQSVVEARLKNVHTCLFNQHRVRLSVNQSQGAYINNVYQNNIIPIMMDLTNNDQRYTNFDCNGVYQYSPYNISQLNTVVYTNTIRDEIFFAANLRGGAYETINIVLTMSPLTTNKFEGLAKVQDGGSFVYWNPANGPNSFLVCGSPVSIILATRNDLTLDCEVFPTTTTTFNPVIYHMFTIQDPAEIMRTWTLLTYTNNYGFGDAATAVFVGGAMGTDAMLNPGDFTIVKVTLINNSGFEWNLLGGAVEAVDLGEKAINANDLISGSKHTIFEPTKYNFLQLNITPEIQPYITIIPYNPYIDVSPQYFDFLSVNLMTIPDGSSSDFYYMLNVSASLPDSLSGKVYEIGVNLIKSYFDKLPGYNDPTIPGYHDYNLSIPSFKFGIPYTYGPYKGNIYYTSGFSTNLIVNATIPDYWSIDGARIISDVQLTSFRMASANPDNYTQLLEGIWDTLDNDTIIVTNKSANSQNVVTLNFSNSFPSFPKKNGTLPDIASFNVLLKANTSQLPYGTVNVISNPSIYFSDFTGKNKSAVIPAPTTKTVNVKGAWLSVSYVSSIVVPDGNGSYKTSPDQRVFAQDTQFVVQVNLTARNIGTAAAYNVNFTIILASGVSVITKLINPGLAYNISTVGVDTTVKINPVCDLAPGDADMEILYLIYKKNGRRLLSTGSLVLFQSLSADVDLTASSIHVTQTIATPLTFSVSSLARDVVTLDVISITNGPNGLPVIGLQATATTSVCKDPRFIFYYCTENLVCTDNTTDSNGFCSRTFSTTNTIIRAISSTTTASSTPIPSYFTGTVTSAEFNYTVEAYDDQMNLLATGWRAINYKLPVNNPQSNQTNPSNQTNVVIVTPTPQNNSQPNNTIQNNTNNPTNNTIIEQHINQESSSFPLWAIILIPVCGVTLIIIAAIILIKRYRKRVKVVNDTVATESPAIPENPKFYT